MSYPRDHRPTPAEQEARARELLGAPVERRPGHDWEVDYLDEGQSELDTIGVSDCATIEDALEKARHTLDGAWVTGSPREPTEIVAVRRAPVAPPAGGAQAGG